jgi:hypothetical protein
MPKVLRAVFRQKCILTPNWLHELNPLHKQHSRGACFGAEERLADVRLLELEQQRDGKFIAAQFLRIVTSKTGKIFESAET